MNPLIKELFIMSDNNATKTTSPLIKKLFFWVGFFAIAYMGYAFVSTHDKKSSLRHEKTREMTSYTGRGMTGSKDESFRSSMNKSSLVINGYNTELKSPTRTLVTYNGVALLLNRILTDEDTADGFDLVLMADTRVFICKYKSDTDCWLVISGASKIPELEDVKKWRAGGFQSQ